MIKGRSELGMQKHRTMGISPRNRRGVQALGRLVTRLYAKRARYTEVGVEHPRADGSGETSVMELGNLIFGNSRGVYEIPRGAGWEEELYRLFEAYAPSRDNSWREYGSEFENGTFAVFPYYWGDCTCGYEEREAKWSDEHKHDADCYQAGYAAIQDDPKKPWQKPDKDVKALCSRHGIPWNRGLGSAVHCTCSHDRDWAGWRADNDHDPACPIVRPNFHYKPQDFRLKWYKYPLRDSYANQLIDIGDLVVIVDRCIASLT